MSYPTIRRDICGECGEGCKVDHADPCASCYRRIWHARTNCHAVARPVPAASVPVAPVQPASQLRTVRAWRRMGYRLVSRAERRQRGPICAGCVHVIRHANGLLGCNAGCNCGAAAVSVMRTDARCKERKWLAAVVQASGNRSA